jgi:translation initiation factor 1
MALVWSSGVGRVCPACGKAESACRCPRTARSAQQGRSAAGADRSAPAPPRSSGKIVVRIEKKGRAGKAVTLIEGLPLGEAELAVAAKELKSRSGTGGTVRDRTIELQGDKLDLAKSWLRERGLAD